LIGEGAGFLFAVVGVEPVFVGYPTFLGRLGNFLGESDDFVVGFGEIEVLYAAFTWLKVR
jgi:hypothetical protein